MALYLVGDEDVHQAKSGFFYLDPHFVNPAIPSEEVGQPEHLLDFAPYLS